MKGMEQRRLSPSPAFTSSGWLRCLWYELDYWLAAAGTSVLFSLRTQGQRNMPRTGPVLVLANHQSFLDPVLAGVAARRHLHYLARRTLFRHWGLSWLMRSLNAIPIDQEGFARQGLKTILAELEAGHAVLVFPEGERTADGQMHSFRPGIHLLIKRVAMPIVPVGIAGAYEAWPRWRAYPVPAPIFLPPRPGRLAVSVGAPLDSSTLAGEPRELVLARLFAAVQTCQQQAERLRRNRTSL
jgi:1-acyl-sn-glycerol-3-phosphate acyltransferase